MFFFLAVVEEIRTPADSPKASAGSSGDNELCAEVYFEHSECALRSNHLALSAKKKYTQPDRKCYTEITMQPGENGNFRQPQADAPAQTAAPAPDAYRPQQRQTDLLSWQASEYVHHEKERLWFVMLGLGGLVLLAVAIFLVQSYTFAVLIIVMTIALGVYAVRQPKIVSYQISPSGVQINDKLFHFHDFRYFGVIEDGPLYSIMLVPNKRFMPAVNLYFPVENGEAIVDAIGSRLPMEHIELDSFDKMMRYLRF